MSRAVELLTNKLPAAPRPYSQRLRDRLPFAAQIPLHASLTYLFGICLFSISFLVFLNASLSFVVTDLFGVQDGVGTVVGTLGFVDELVAVFMVVFWGALSDRIGTRLIAVSGYFIVGISLVVVIQVKSVYPGLLFARILFSIGASATVVSVTAVLPEISSLPPTPASISHTTSGEQRLNGNLCPSDIPKTNDSSSSPSSNRDRNLSSNRSDAARCISSTSSTPALPLSPSRPHTPSRPLRRRPGSRSQQRKTKKHEPKVITGKLSGLVGFTTGCGALIALVFFLPLPAKFSENNGMTRVQALKHTFYAVAVIAWVVSLGVFLGLRGGGVGGEAWELWKIGKILRSLGRQRKGKSSISPEEEGSINDVQDGSPDERTGLLASSEARSGQDAAAEGRRNGVTSTAAQHKGEGETWKAVLKRYSWGLWLALNAGREDWRIGLGYLGGFVARSMSVGISLFIPLYVNQWMRQRGMCPPVLPSDPDYKKACHEAYILAAMLTGTSQLSALIFAPIIGYFSDRYEPQYPLMITAVLGFISCAAFSALQSLSVGADRSWAFVHCAFMGIGQIGAIVASLALIGNAIHDTPQSSSLQELQASQTTTEMPQSSCDPIATTDFQQKPSRLAVKGSISGVYSLCGAAGILLLTQFGGWGADHVNAGFAFDLLAAFFSIEIALGCWLIFRAKSQNL